MTPKSEPYSSPFSPPPNASDRRTSDDRDAVVELEVVDSDGHSTRVVLYSIA